MTETYKIESLHSVQQLLEVQKLEELVWNMEPTPIHQTLTAVKNGGIVLGAYQDNLLIGFSYGFPGFLEGTSYLCSHMLGIHPDFQGKGIGAALKKAQQDEATRLGYQLITWTYDPLESVNAYLNLTKLRAICSTYIENCYGEMEDSLNHGLPTDRFKVEWWINSAHLTNQKQWEIDDKNLLVQWDVNESGLPYLTHSDLSLLQGNETLLLPIPKKFQTIKKEAYGIALEWRKRTRELFKAAFNEGYAAVEVIQNTHLPVHYYVLIKRDTLQVES